MYKVNNNIDLDLWHVTIVTCVYVVGGGGVYLEIKVPNANF